MFWKTYLVMNRQVLNLLFSVNGKMRPKKSLCHVWGFPIMTWSAVAPIENWSFYNIHSMLSPLRLDNVLDGTWNVHFVPIIVNWASQRKLQESDSCFCSMFSCVRKNMVHQLFDKDFHCIFALWLDSRWNVVRNVPQLWVWGRLAGKLGQPGFSRSLHHHILCTT